MASTSSSALQPESFLRNPSNENVPRPPKERAQTTCTDAARYRLIQKKYTQQYSDMYFLRLTELKPVVEKLAYESWEGFEVGGEEAHSCDRVLDVRQGELCWVTGTIYKDMPLKPNILDDITKDHFLIPPPPREKYVDMGLDQTMLEDESGRLKLSGSVLESQELVTGVIVSVLGSESATGDFSVIDIKIPDLAPQKPLPGGSLERKRVALASGLAISGALHEGLGVHMLTEYLVGEAGGETDHEEAASITHLVLAGNSLSDVAVVDDITTVDTVRNRTKKYGYDAAAYNPLPTKVFDNILSSLLPSLPVTILPGELDPANISLPQQQLHAALFPAARLYDGTTLTRATNPWAGTIDGVDFLVTSGQNLDDVYKYVEGDNRLGMCENMLRWRNIAPTAPDTLWSYPFQDIDPFVIGECPHVLVIGNQKRFETCVVDGKDGQKVRVILVPKFEGTGQIVELDLSTLVPEVVSFHVEQ